MGTCCPHIFDERLIRKMVCGHFPECELLDRRPMVGLSEHGKPELLDIKKMLQVYSIIALLIFSCFKTCKDREMLWI